MTGLAEADRIEYDLDEMIGDMHLSNGKVTIEMRKRPYREPRVGSASGGPTKRQREAW